MDIKFIFSEEGIKNEFPTLQSFLSKMQRNKIPYYFPFTITNKKSHPYVINKIKKDRNNLLYRRRYSVAKKEWLKLKGSIVNCLLTSHIIKKYGKLLPEYICIMTPYGPQGYYNPPHTIIISVKLNKVSNILETITHELIHLALYEYLGRFSYKEREEIVDNIILKSDLKNIFTKYKPQTIQGLKFLL